MAYSIVLLLLIGMNFFIKTANVKNKEKSFLIFSFIVLVCLAGFRYENGHGDFFVNYRRIIQAYHMSWRDNLSFTTEFGHQLFRKVVAILFREPQMYFLLSSALIVFAQISVAWKYADNYFLYILLFYSIFGFFPSNNITRQAMAVAICALSLPSIIRKNLVQYIALMILAVLVHTSAIFFIPMYFLANVHFSKNSLYGYILLSSIVLLLRRQIIAFFLRFLYTEYAQEGAYGTVGSNPLRLLVALMVVLFVYLLSNRTQSEDGKMDNLIDTERLNNVVIHGGVLYVFCMLMSTLSMLMFARVSLYYACFAMLCIDKGIQRTYGRNRLIIYLLVLLFVVSYFSVMNMAGKLIPTPYTPFWQFPDRPRIV